MQTARAQKALTAFNFSWPKWPHPHFVCGDGVILRFNRVRPKSLLSFQPNAADEITPQFFEKILRHLTRKKYSFLSMDGIEQALKSGKMPERRFVAITLDGGYRDQYEYAFPILEKYHIPFTFYLSPAIIDHHTNIWKLTLEEIIRQQECIAFSIKGKNQFLGCKTSSQKYALFQKIEKYIQINYTPSEQSEIIAEIAWRYKIDPQRICQHHAITWQQAYEMSKSPYGTVGSLAQNSDPLSSLSQGDLAREIKQSLLTLESALGEKPRHLAYPFGSHIHVGKREYQCAHELGLTTAVTGRAAPVFMNHAPHLTALPRFNVTGNQSLFKFKIQISGYPSLLYAPFDRLQVN